MIRIVVQANVADQIRRSDGQIELVDDQGNMASGSKSDVVNGQSKSKRRCGLIPPQSASI